MKRLKPDDILAVIPATGWYSSIEIMHIYNEFPEQRYTTENSIKAHLFTLAKTGKINHEYRAGVIDFIDVAEGNFAKRKFAKRKVNYYSRIQL